MTAGIIIYLCAVGAVAVMVGFIVGALVTSGAQEDAYRFGLKVGEAERADLEALLDKGYGGDSDDD